MDITLLKHQYDFLTSKEKYILLLAGIGAGKSFAGAHYVISKVASDGAAQGLICANTYRQLKNSTLACLFNQLDAIGIPFHHKENKGELMIGGSKILTLSLENYDYMRGIEIGWFWADEVRDTKEEAFLVLMGRLRDRRCNLEGRLTSSPDGFNWLHKYFKENQNPDFKLIHADTRSNTYLPDGFVESLLSTYDEKMIEQEVEGKFVNLSAGRVYYSFDRSKHVKDFKELSTPKKAGCDFNVNPVTAVQGFYENDVIYIYDEIFLKNSNTFELASNIVEKWGKIEIYPDATGKARKTSATKTDHEILRDSGLFVQYNPNPHVKDRWNCVNGLISHGKLIIHPRCKNLIRDLEQLSYENKDDMLSHISDALGYLCWGLAPLKRPQTPARASTWV